MKKATRTKTLVIFVRKPNPMEKPAKTLYIISLWVRDIWVKYTLARNNGKKRDSTIITWLFRKWLGDKPQINVNRMDSEVLRKFLARYHAGNMIKLEKTELNSFMMMKAS